MTLKLRRAKKLSAFSRVSLSFYKRTYYFKSKKLNGNKFSEAFNSWIFKALVYFDCPGPVLRDLSNENCSRVGHLAKKLTCDWVAGICQFLKICPLNAQGDGNLTEVKYNGRKLFIFLGYIQLHYSTLRRIESVIGSYSLHKCDVIHFSKWGGGYRRNRPKLMYHLKLELLTRKHF